MYLCCLLPPTFVIFLPSWPLLRLLFRFVNDGRTLGRRRPVSVDADPFAPKFERLPMDPGHHFNGHEQIRNPISR